MNKHEQLRDMMLPLNLQTATLMKTKHTTSLISKWGLELHNFVLLNWKHYKTKDTRCNKKSSGEEKDRDCGTQG